MDHRALANMFDALEARRGGKQEPIELPGADLQCAVLIRADLINADLGGALLGYANLSGVRFGRARLRKVSLRNAQLDAADLTEADLRGADLQGARVRGACFAGADLRGACIADLVGVLDSIVGAKIDKATCERSGLDDHGIIALFRQGADIVDLGSFSEAVRAGCVRRTDASNGFSDELMHETETVARRERLARDLSIPPASRRSQEMKRLSLPAPAGAARSSPPMRAAPLPKDLLQLAAGAGHPSGLMAAVVVPKPHQAGDVVLGVKLEAVVGRGHSAIVWRGRSDDGDEAAVKLFDVAAFATGLMLPAFRRGVRDLNRLLLDIGDNPHSLVRLRGVATNQLGFVTDYYRNGNLASLPALGWPTAKLVDCFIRICTEVARAHGSGVLHRCLTPGNVLLDDDLQPLLTDFNMVDLASLAAESDAVGGYAAYAAPEEILDVSTMSPTADIYSLGRILTFMLLGHEPPDSVEEVPMLECLQKQPSGLTRIIRKCTLRDPAVRYQFVSELIADLERYEDYQHVGIAGGALETNFMPYRISSLPYRAPDAAARDVPSERPPVEKPQPGKRGVDAPLITRSIELGIGAVGGVLMLGAAGLLALTPLPEAGTRSAVDIIAAMGVALATLALPGLSELTARRRAAFALALGGICYLLSPGDLGNVRLRVTMGSASPERRGDALRLLARAGDRDFANSDLSKADLSRSEVSSASFRAATLRATNFDDAVVIESDFEGADVTDASVRGAMLTLTNLDRAEGWETVTCDELTLMPEGWVCIDEHPKKAEG